MAKEEYNEDESVDDFQGTPESLREDDEITDEEEAFLEGYDKESDEEEEESKEEKEDEFDI